ncbi:hypothetical protein CYMTET_49443 [Cymbomonas tetramitiformis]|uniref:Uncharacterized protein n=1 Tax=Cymbomonas tetramitiformis TaxID=36881 RepID=A0AAE0BRD4_9CHLO|nr:hypothetical protein CYMTET_49443 [Cymbomonas tetramitiformis]
MVTESKRKDYDQRERKAILVTLLVFVFLGGFSAGRVTVNPVLHAAMTTNSLKPSPPFSLPEGVSYYKGPRQERFKVTKEDILAAVPTATHRHMVVYTTGLTWREGLKTFVASNGTQLDALELHHSKYLFGAAEVQERVRELEVEFPGPPRSNISNSSIPRKHLEEAIALRPSPLEVWDTYPDEVPKQGYTPGDKRMIALVRMANASFAGKYKWMLYGDDDTYFFMSNILEELQGLDPDMPYLITDDVGGCCHIKWCAEPPNTCVLPHFSDTAKNVTSNSMCVLQEAVAPCTWEDYNNCRFGHVNSERWRAQMKKVLQSERCIARDLAELRRPMSSTIAFQHQNETDNFGLGGMLDTQDMYRKVSELCSSHPTSSSHNVSS